MSELLNRTIGGYQLLELIGGGGVAEVYRARQAAGDAREVAVKVIFPEFARQPGVAANFARIIQATPQLANHPHILPVIGSGEENKYLYLVTPLVKEGTLAGWIEKGGRLGVSDVGPFFQQLCGAVAYAHSLGLTHGNIKPSNVYLFEGRHVLLGDFGLLWDVGALDPSWTGSDVAAFEYLAPEVFDGHASPSSDIYSLGATLYATLTGHAPFQARRLGDLISAARQRTPPSLAQETPPLAPPITALDAVIQQAMAKQAAQRYPSAATLAQAIEATLRQAAQSAQFAPPAPAAVLGGGAPVAPPASFAPGGQPWGLAAAPVAPAPMSGAAPLAQPDPPFPVFPPMAAPEPVMGMNGLGAAPPAPGVMFAAPPTQRVEPLAPSGAVDGPTMRVAAPPGVMDGPTMLIAAPAPEAPDTRFDVEFEPMPQARTPQAEPELAEAARSGQFSATELGLPRLTNPAMGDLPPDWRELISDESARRRHDPFAMSESDLAPLPPIEDFGASRGDLLAIPPPRAEAGQGERVVDEWGASNVRQVWEEPDQNEVAAAGWSGGQADYDIERMTSERPALRRGGRGSVAQDTLQSQKVWTNSRTIVRGKRRSKAPFFTVVALLALAALELSGLAVIRPDLCVTHTCSVVAAYVHRTAPGLHIPGVTAPVHLIPVVPQISVIANGSGQDSFTLANNSMDPITWSATPTLAWMTVSPARGSLKGGESVRLTVTVKPHGVAPGVYTGALTVYVGEGMSELPVVVTIKPGAQLTVAQRALTFDHCGASQNLSLSNTGGAKLAFTASPSQTSALSVSPGQGTLVPGASTALSVTISCDAVAGTTYAIIIVSDGGSAQINVTYR